MIVEGSESTMLIFHWFFNDFGGGSESNMLIFHWFFNDFEGVGVGNVDFPFVFQWFLGCSLSRRISGGSVTFIRRTRRTPQGRIQGSFLPLEEPSSETLLGKNHRNLGKPKETRGKPQKT